MFGAKSEKTDAAASEPAPAVRAELAELAKLGEARPELAEFVRLYERLLPAMFGDFGPVAGQPVAEPVRERLAAGVPLFRAEPPELDTETLLGGWLIVCDCLQRHREPDEVRQLREAAARREIDPASALRSVIARGPREFHDRLTERGLDVQLGLSVLRLCSLPVLERIVRSLELDWQRLGWAKGYCPVCGSGPLLAEFRGLEQLRWLRCGWCGAGWPVDWLFCPFCETRDHRKFQDLFVDVQEQKYRVSVCDACRGFVRGISTITPLTIPGLLVAELETLHLEIIARERSYSAEPRLTS